MQNVKPEIESGWGAVLADQFDEAYFAKLKGFLLEEKRESPIYPPGRKIFAAFDETPFDQVKVVILGQDPYHGPGQANGLCFSVADGMKHPPSLQNIFKELNQDLNIPYPESGDLKKWAKQGVLLLNATLTVRKGQAGSHQNIGWEEFTNTVIQRLSEKRSGLVFLLWGRFAQNKESFIDTSKHFVLKASHPSPFSAHKGFFGCKHFSRTNNILIDHGLEPIDWDLSKE